jgi:hypothetical protein
MANTTEEPFRFMDLPGELRNEIYALLLCSFKQPHTMKHEANAFGPTVARHAIDTAILRTNSEIHREAYDVMVKTNGFIRIDFTDASRFHGILDMFSVPIVAADKAQIEQFQGFVLKLTCAYKYEELAVKQHDLPATQGAVMVRAEDAQRLCCAIRSSSFLLKLGIEVAPALSAQPARYRPLFDTFFSDKTQRKILLPFQYLIRGLEHFDIWGKVLPSSLENAIRREVALDEWTDPSVAIGYALKAKSCGDRAFEAGHTQRACRAWSIATIDITRMRIGGSWPKLIERGGDDFIDEIAGIQFSIYMNAMDIGLQRRRAYPVGNIMEIDANIGVQLALAFDIMDEHYWNPGYTWIPSETTFANLQYRQAHFLRLLHNPDDAELALEIITDAVEVVPDNEEFQKERLIILQWGAEDAQHHIL